MSSLPLLVNPRSGGGFSDDNAKRLVELFRKAGAEPQLHLARSHDEMLGIANIAAGNPGMTARLTVHYRRPTPLFLELRFRAWVDRVEGRRIMSRAELWDGDTLTAQADGLFVRPTPARALEIFGHSPDDDAS